MKKLICSLIFLSMMILPACGGGGGGGEETTTIPDTPTNVRAMAGRGHVSGANASYNYVVVRWNASSGATSYTIYYSTTDSNVTTASSKVTGVTDTYHLFTNAPADFKLWFAVTASNSAGESDLSSVKRMVVQIAATGQTTSYAANDDGALQKGVSWTSDRYIYYDDGTLLDTMTGLMWPGTYLGLNPIATDLWSIALSLCEGYTIAGYSDWRLPNRRELMSLMDYSSIYLDNENYWTSTTDAQNTTQAWALNNISGLASLIKSLYSCNVIPVRDAYGLATAEVARTGAVPLSSYTEITGEDALLQNGVIWPSARFTDNGDGTVTDILTSLMWLKDAGTITSRAWASAVSTAADYDDGVYDDWRLPNIRELETLLDMSGDESLYLPADYPFLNIQNIYWTSTTKAESASTSNAWYINFSTGSILAAGKDTTYYVWPVRSTQ